MQEACGGQQADDNLAPSLHSDYTAQEILFPELSVESQSEEAYRFSNKVRTVVHMQSFHVNIDKVCYTVTLCKVCESDITSFLVLLVITTTYNMA